MQKSSEISRKQSDHYNPQTSDIDEQAYADNAPVHKQISRIQQISTLCNPSRVNNSALDMQKANKDLESEL